MPSPVLLVMHPLEPLVGHQACKPSTGQWLLQDSQRVQRAGRSSLACPVCGYVHSPQEGYTGGDFIISMPSCSSHLLWPVTQVQSWRRDLDLAPVTLWRLQGVKETIPPEVSSLIKFVGEAWNTLLKWSKLMLWLVLAAARLPPQELSLPFPVTVTALEWPLSLSCSLMGGLKIAISVPGQCATWCSANLWQPSIHSSSRCGWTVHAPDGTVSELPHGLLLQMEEDQAFHPGHL